MKIKNIDNIALLDYYNKAVRDESYNPSGEKYNQSRFTLEKLEKEILRRMNR